MPLGDGTLPLLVLPERYELFERGARAMLVREAELRYVDHQGNQVSLKKRRRISFLRVETRDTHGA
jgi:hypothetical protein